MFSQNDHQMILVGGAATKTTAAFASSMNVNEIGVFTPGGTRYTEATADAGDEFVLALKTSDGYIITSEKLNKSKVTRVTRKVAVADANQLSYVGYNGTSGSIVAANDNFYRIRVAFKEPYGNNPHGTTYIKHAIYQSDSSANQAEIAIKLAKSGNDNMSREPKNSSGDAAILYKAICNTALDTAYDITNTVTVVKGSNKISVATNLTYNTAAGTLAVGDFIRMADSDTTPTLSSNVYRVTAIDSLVVTLDRPYTGASGTLTDAADSTQVIPSATGIAADWGVTITANDLDFLVSANGGGSMRKYQKVIFNVGLDGFDTTAQGTTTAANLGAGQYEQIAELESFLRGNNGEQNRIGQPNLFQWTLQATSANGPYDVIEIEFTDKVNSLNIIEKTKKLTLAIPNSTPNYAVSGTADDITDVLEDLLAGVPVYGGAVTANGGALAAGDLAI